MFRAVACMADCSALANITQTVSPGNFVVQRDTPIGTVIRSVNLPLNNQQIGSCSTGGVALYYAFTYNGAQSTAYAHYYATPIPGIAMSVSVTGYSGNINGYYDNPQYIDSFYGGVGIYTGSMTTISFIKTGSVVPGVMPSGQLGTFSGGTGGAMMKLNMNSLVVTQAACSITTPNLTFPIGNVLASNFGTTIGAIPTGAQNTQNLGLNCDAGANVNISLTGTQNPDVGSNSVLALTGQGSAGVANGVGVQILYNNSPLSLNSNVVLKTSTGGQEIFPLTARYYQTKTTVTTGSANASATLNLTYQ